MAAWETLPLTHQPAAAHAVTAASHAVTAASHTAAAAADYKIAAAHTAAAAAADTAAAAANYKIADSYKAIGLALPFRVRIPPPMAAADDYYKVWKTRPLTNQPAAAAAAAAAILDKIAEQVRPIMRRHGWRVKLLSEFCAPGFLGLNYSRGALIKIRLRHPDRDWELRPYEEVLDTMLHELCHNAIGPHNAAFNKLWNQLRKECAELGAAKKRRHTAQAAVAAEKRRRVGDVVPVKANRVGGDSGIMKALTPVQAVAMAAERRMMDDLCCGSVSQVGKSSSRAIVGLGSSSSRPITEVDMDIGELWECTMCTLFNKALALICEACGTQKLEAISLQLKTWSCIFCTLQNDIKLDKCAACEQRR